MTSGFDAGALERRYQFLDDCPDTLLSLVITSPIGELRERCEGLRAWRDALLSGREPPETPWPPTAVGEPARRAIAELGLARFCRDQPELTDELLRDVLASFTRADADLRREIARRLHELEHERERAAKLKSTRDHGDRLEPSAADVRARDRVAIERLVAAAANMADRELLAGWSERARAWAAIADVFGDLGAMLGRGWDLAQGVLRHVGWNDLVRLRALIARIPQLQDIVRSLGRLHETHGDASVAEQLLVPVRRLEEELRAVPTPLVPIELKGIERSGDLARMLPVEAVMLGHSKLRLLWHARRAERALLTYRAEGADLERVLIERDASVAETRQRPRPERGPILAVVDTSGSMNGTPELVAKAIVLEAVRIAHAERRRCYLYAYSGPGQVLEHELNLAPEGIGRLLDFLSASFGGGTDIGALTRVVTRLGQEAWKRADVILVSDGEWQASAAIVSAVARAKESGTRFHGVQVGAHGHTGMHSLCEPVHQFRDWAHAGGWR